MLKELLEYFEEILPEYNPYVASYFAYKELSEEATRPEMSLTFHDNLVPSGEHTRRYNAPGNTEMFAVASSLEDRNPPLTIRHREEIMAYGRPKLHIISNTDGQYDRLFCSSFSRWRKWLESHNEMR